MDDDAPVRDGGKGNSARPSALTHDKSGSAQDEVRLPAISVPRGGGAIRGIGEKFTVNPVTGTGSFTVPLNASPGRSGFGPELTLSYDSGTGNGPFGFGWTLSLPSITRKTDKGLPRYEDGEESDVFVLSGAEDLVPVLGADGNRHPDTITAPGFTIDRYRPRIEGLFARIERWTDLGTGDVHWRSISRDNVTTLYGPTGESRIARDGRIFTWLISASYDDKGNVISYSYVPEDGTGVDTSLAAEQARERASNRYVKRIRYGNTTSRLTAPNIDALDWLFEVVFDYDEPHFERLPLDPARPADEQHRFVHATAEAPPASSWTVRPDPFSSYRSGFEVRTYRRCRRILVFHTFAELGAGPCLVRATELDYADLDYTQPFTVDDELAHQGSTRIASFVQSITQSGYVRDSTKPAVQKNGVDYGTYLEKSLPPIELEYSKAVIQDQLREVDGSSLENLPAGLDGTRYQWVDLDGEGVSGILTEQAGSWFYKANLGGASFGSLETVAAPSLANLTTGRQQLLDLTGDGQLDLVAFRRPTPGYFERTDGTWEQFRPFRALPVIAWDDPNLRLVDLDGDGLTDVLVTENDAFTAYRSLAGDGFGPAVRVPQAADEERGPRLVFADDTQAIYVADMSGDGLTDLVRIRNGDVCYWPNLGYGSFGARVTMDASPRLDTPDGFDERRVRLADIDGSGTSDLIYLGGDRVRLYFNQSGNLWSSARPLDAFPPIDDLAAVMPADLLGNGTSCLVWSTPAPADARSPMRYVDLMGGTKPHLLVKSVNNLGAETHVEYASSTSFYLADKSAGTPWITRIPFPVHVVARMETVDRISRNRFATRYTYHHGYFDGVEREFRGFGRVDQWDTEELGAFTPAGDLPAPANVDFASHVPPVLTRTWFHTGIYLGRAHVSDFFAGLTGEGTGEYYREPGLSDDQARALLLDDTELPEGLTADEEREACRALKGSMLRQETYALDGWDAASEERARHAYVVTEQNFGLQLVQPMGENRHAVLLSQPNEAITYHYERNPADPRVKHVLTLEVDAFGNVLKEATVGYGRRQADPVLTVQADRDAQTATHVTYSRYGVTNAVDDVATHPDDHRAPRRCESSTYELTGYAATGAANRYQAFDLVESVAGVTTLRVDEEIEYEEMPDLAKRERRLIEQRRTLFRADDLSALLPLHELQPLALPGQSYRLAFTPGLIAQAFSRDGQQLLPNPDVVLGGQAGDRGGYVASQLLKADGLFPATDPDGRWWAPSGRVYLSPGSGDTSAQERAYARSHFYLPHRARDPFHSAAVSTESSVVFDGYDLLTVDSIDAIGNRITVGERRADGSIDPARPGNDYRVLEPTRLTDPNRNRRAVAFDALGHVAGTAVMGKTEENVGDSIDAFVADLSDADLLGQMANPLAAPAAALGGATTRLLYDLFAYRRTSAQPDPSPTVAYTLARETHVSDLAPGAPTRFQHAFSYTDGFGREIQKKARAEPGPLVVAGPALNLRWVGSGWTIFNNKGEPVRKYEPYFSATHRFEFGVQVGVSPVAFYDPIGRSGRDAASERGLREGRVRRLAADRVGCQ